MRSKRRKGVIRGKPIIKRKKEGRVIFVTDPVAKPKLTIDAHPQGCCTYYRESNYYSNGDDRISERVTERDGYVHVISYRARKM